VLCVVLTLSHASTVVLSLSNWRFSHSNVPVCVLCVCVSVFVRALVFGDAHTDHTR